MKVLIIEDENRAAAHLERLLTLVAPDMQVMAQLESVRDAVLFLQSGERPELIFSDIQLADGLSFEIYRQVSVSCPIIFTTAYDQYAIEAFKTNGIDYLLKPIDAADLGRAVQKARLLSPALLLEKLMAIQPASEAKSYKERFMVKVGDKIKSIPTAEIAVFYSSEKASFLFTTEKRVYAVDYPLDQLEQLLDPKMYFRINRKYIVHINACTDMLAWSNSRLRIKLEGMDDPDMIVARERVQEFKNWLDR